MNHPGEPPGWSGSDGDPGERDRLGEQAGQASEDRLPASGHSMSLSGLAGRSDEPAGRFAAADPPKPESDPEPQPARSHLRALTGGRASSAESQPEPDDQPIVEGPPADFRVRCPDCGPQYVAIADVRFVSTGGGAETDRYLFTCPACGLRVRRPAGPELAEILKTSGVATLALHRRPDQAL